MKNKLASPIFRKILPLLAVGVLASCNIQLPSGDRSGKANPKVDIDKPVKVALLVPTDSANPGLNEVGMSILNAARLAEKRLNQDEIELVVYSTGGNPARAAKVAAEAQNSGANLIIGPLKSEEVLGLVNNTQVPILSFSNNTSVADGDVYILGTNFENIADRVIKYQKAQGGRNLGVVYSNDVGGRQGAQATLQAAKNGRVNIVAQQGYELSQENITARAPQIAQALRGSGADMVMFTDYPAGGLSLIASGIRDAGFDSSNARYLGLARWSDNAEGLSASGLNGLFTIPDPSRTAQFNQLYQQDYGSTPHALAGLGYDGVIAAIYLIREARQSGDNTPFSANDIKGVTFPGANGAIRFDGNKADRALAVQMLKNGVVTTVSPAPSGF